VVFKIKAAAYECKTHTYIKNANRAKPQERPVMRGFDAEFKDLDHYIRVITERIWEGRRIEDIRRYYTDPCIVETPSSVSSSVQAVIDGTHATLAMFPDRRLLAEDVIQSGSEEGGFLSSHRIISPMTHTGDGVFGKATGRAVQVRTIADCVCKDNRITHEWLVRDQAAIALQIGTTPQALAQDWLNARGGWNKPVAPTAPAYYQSHVSLAPQAVGYAQAIEAFSHGRAPDRDLIAASYDDAVQQLGPGGLICYGHAQVGDYWARLFAALPAHTFTIEHLALQTGAGRADRVALRWRARCSPVSQAFSSCSPINTSVSSYQNNNKKDIEIMGINHVEFYKNRVLREYVLIDEVALWMQLLQPQAA
jgi:predicted ester cyclase